MRPDEISIFIMNELVSKMRKSTRGLMMNLKRTGYNSKQWDFQIMYFQLFLVTVFVEFRFTKWPVDRPSDAPVTL